MNEHEPPPFLTRYADDFDYVAVVGFEEMPHDDEQVERVVEALGGVVLQRQYAVTGGVVRRRSWFKRLIVRHRLLVRLFGLHRPRPLQ
jgi:hypothetical protein